MQSDDIVDLRSDTVTRPTAGMRDAMHDAALGDDVFGEDPTVNALEERVASMLGKEAALWVPSGTMANLVALLSQTRPGDCILLHEDAHPLNYESGNISAVAGLLPKTLPGELGILAAETIGGAYNSGENHHFAPTTLATVENTTNRGGGNIYTPEALAEIRQTCDGLGMHLHCDGARIFNAVVATGCDVQEFARHAHTLCFCFSKGLGAPAGSIVTGPAETMNRARRYRKMLGGGLRQAGVLAAAGIYALDHHIDRLADDHKRAAAFREVVQSIDGCTVPLPSPTNIVFVEIDDAPEVSQALLKEGIHVLTTSPRHLRFVFHIDIDDADLDRAIDAFRTVAGS